MATNWLEIFLHESEELLAEIEEAVLRLKDSDDSKELIDQIFRAFHTLKGSSSMCGLNLVGEFTHVVETMLDEVRSGETAVSPRLIEIVLAAKDQIKNLIAAEHAGLSAMPESGNELMRVIGEFSGAKKMEHQSPAKDSAQPSDDDAAPEANARVWKIYFRPDPLIWATGGNPFLLFKELAALGHCEVVGNTESVPSIDEIDPNCCYLSWTATLHTAADESAIRDVFIFVEDGAELKIEVVEAAQAHSEEAAPIAVARPVGDVTELRKQTAEPLVGSRVLPKESTVRVPSARLDRLINLVGELVMNQSRLSQAAAQVGAPELALPVQEIERLIAELRDDVLGIRMLPIGTIFGRFRRLVHDLSTELGKDIDFVTEGDETELDKSILDQIGEPLVHMLRNCVDHGIEPGEARLQAGKPRRGTIRLAAAHRGSDVVVSVEDDGRGLNRVAIRAKAVERRLIAADAQLSDKELLHLILLPGFSTAQQVTSVSGRGVGMDVLKRQIEMLRGALSIESEEGKGCRISITLPLTLAIIEGLLVQVGSSRLIVPMSAVTENVELDTADRVRNNGRNLIAVRGELVPYIDLRQTFAMDGMAPRVEKIVIVRHEDQRVGLVVDKVLGTHQTVIQGLGRFFREIKIVSGATIMGDGGVALILDIAAVINFADQGWSTTGKPVEDFRRFQSALAICPTQ